MLYYVSHRPLFLSEKVLDDIDAHEDLIRQRKAKRSETLASTSSILQGQSLLKWIFSCSCSCMCSWLPRRRDGSFLELSLSRSRNAKVARSSASLLGAYTDLEKQARQKRSETADVFRILETMIKE